MDWARLDDVGGKAVLRFERRLAHRPETVWRVISEPAELAHWFPARVEGELVPGAPLRFVFEDDAADGPGGEVVEVEPPRLLVYTWGGDVLRWEIVPEAAGCRLFFSHTIADDGTSGGRLAAARNAAGWDGCLAGLEARLDGSASPEFDWLARQEGYVERFGLAEGVAEAGAVRFERDLVQAADRVWEVLADGAALTPGGAPPPRFTNGYVPAGAIARAEPPHLLEYAWEHDGAPAGTVRWELRERAFGTLLVLTQTVPAAHAGLRPQALAAWHTHLELLYATLHGAERCWPEGRTEALRERYAARLEAQDAAVRR